MRVGRDLKGPVFDFKDFVPPQPLRSTYGSLAHLACIIIVDLIHVATNCRLAKAFGSSVAMPRLDHSWRGSTFCGRGSPAY